jgi:hypothetical protein
MTIDRTGVSRGVPHRFGAARTKPNQNVAQSAESSRSCSSSRDMGTSVERQRAEQVLRPAKAMEWNQPCNCSVS